MATDDDDSFGRLVPFTPKVKWTPPRCARSRTTPALKHEFLAWADRDDELRGGGA
jgi:hypothetical protein